MLDKRKTVIALGYFDSVHIGHQKVMQKAKAYALSKSASFLAFSFGGNLKSVLSNSEDKSIYLPFEREEIIMKLGADQVYFAPVSTEFLSMSPNEFLNFINDKYDVIAYACGKDYKFGKNGAGDVDFLIDYAKKNGQECIVVDTQEFLGEKISTTRIKSVLSQGNVKLARQMLGRAYSVTGKVFQDRKVGQKLGFPTVNIKIEKDKFRILDGVYKGKVIIDGKEYSTVINYGARPTFNLNEKLIEAHIIDFNGDLYGQEITLYFDEFMRKVIKFDSVNELKTQLIKDVKQAKERKYD